jgi:hypothetical protein
MKRKAVLIGNTSGLPGVQVDITRFSSFLTSNIGGAWYESEIDVLQNERKSNLLQKIDALKKQSFDYLIVLFSGHGGQLRQTILELNSSGETIEETALRGIATRQLNVYDCCRAFPSGVTKRAMDALSASFSESANPYRRRFDDRIMQATPQQALLYSCSIGQVSYDSSNGGVYLGNLLKAAQTITYDQQFKLVGAAHEEAIPPTVANSEKEKQGRQVPDAVLAKCLSSQQLIISLKA